MKPKLALVVIKTENVKKLKNFYRKFGLRFRKEKHSCGPAHFSATLGGTVFEIYPLGDQEEPGSRLRIGFRVKNLERVVSRLLKARQKIICPPKQNGRGYRAVVMDPDGRSVEIYQR